VFKQTGGGMTYALYANTDTGKPTAQAYVGGHEQSRAVTCVP
jgi:hypothetical protein